jgi:hypothetical protein
VFSHPRNENRFQDTVFTYLLENVAMKNPSKYWLLSALVVLTSLPCGAALGEDAAAPGSSPARPSPLSGLLDLLGSTGLPSLSGLIQPERMGVLSDNPLTVRDNPVDVDLLSGNETNVLSGIKILSGITVHVEIHVYQGERPRSARRAERSQRERDLEQPPASKPARQRRADSEASER